MSARPSGTFWFLFQSLLNNLRNLFIFCINVDIDEMLLLDKNMGQRIHSLRDFFFILLEKLLWHDHIVHAW